MQAVDSSAPGTYLVQFSGPVLDEWQAAVREAGAQLYGYIPDFTFIARMDGNTAAKVSSLPFVRWVGPYHPAYRLANSLRTLDSVQSTGPVTVTIQALPDVDLSALGGQVEALGGTVQGSAANSQASYLRASLPADRMNDLAGLDGVLWVEPYFAPQIYNDVAGGTIMRANELRASLKLFGNGQIVAVADTGLDTGNLSNLHPDVAGRVLKTYCLGRFSPCDWSDYVAHGTHVVGSVLGNGLASGSNPATHSYNGSLAGVAPEAKLIFQSVADSQGGLTGIPFDNGNLMRTAYLDGARIHSDSWGGPTGFSNPYGGYVSSSQQVDQAMWDDKDMLVLFAAGNNGVDADMNGVVDPDSIGQPGTAKNVLTVGASENDRPSINGIWGSSYADPIASDRRANNPSGMAAFSSRGPTDDGRVKPDIVAPGTYIASMRTRQYVFNDDLESGTSGYNTGSISGGTGDNVWGLFNDSGAHSGTHYFKETISGPYGAGAISALVSPAMDVRPAGSSFDLYFWQKYSLSAGDKLAVLVADPASSKVVVFPLSESGASPVYGLRRVTLSLSDFTTLPTSVKIGFGIQSGGASTFSTWTIDDIRVGGASWGALSSVGLASAGDAKDEAYTLMGGTSMATPLTAGAAAVVREWLTRVQGFSSPSGALMKSVLINGAADMGAGQYGTGSTREIPAHRPNNVDGWGRVDLLSSLNPPSPAQIWLKDNTAGLSTGASATYTVTVGPSAASAQPTPASAALENGPEGESPDGGLQPFSNGDFGTQGAAVLSPEGSAQLLQNRGFETGTWAPWQIGSSNATLPSLDNSSSHGGSWSAHLGGDVGGVGTPDIDSIAQPITIPLNTTAVAVDFWYRLDTQEVLQNTDHFCFGMWYSNGSVAWGSCFVDFGVTGSLGWTQETYNLTPTQIAAVAGQKVSFGFQTQNDINLISQAWVDDAGLTVTTPGTTSPALDILPPSGPRGTTFAITGSNFAASSPITLTIDGVKQPSQTSNASGLFTYDFTPPGSIPKGSHTAAASDNAGHTASKSFQIAPEVSVSASPAFGNPGDHFTITGSGFHGGSPISIKLDNQAAGSTTADSQGGFTYNLATSASIADGVHQVTASDDEASSANGSFTIGTVTGGPFRITLAWTDYPGNPLASKALVNDLDLEVIAPDGKHYYGNSGLYASGNPCLRAGTWDSCNNVEGINIPGAVYGTYTVIVHGYNVPHGPQPFALVASRDGSGGTGNLQRYTFLPFVSQ